MLKYEESGVITLEAPPESDLLDTYIKEHNELLETYQWLRGKLTAAQQRAWETNIKALSTLCRALEAGFDPFVTPKGWHKGRLTQYTAAIPADVREALDVALPIFGQDNVYIVDPNADHFVKPEVRDPAAVGEIRLATGQMFQLLIGCWDLAEDRQYIEAHPVPQNFQNFPAQGNDWARGMLERQRGRELGSGYVAPFPVDRLLHPVVGGREPMRGLRRQYLRTSYGGPEVAAQWKSSLQAAVSAAR